MTELTGWLVAGGMAVVACLWWNTARVWKGMAQAQTPQVVEVQRGEVLGYDAWQLHAMIVCADRGKMPLEVLGALHDEAVKRSCNRVLFATPGSELVSLVREDPSTPRLGSWRRKKNGAPEVQA